MSFLRLPVSLRGVFHGLPGKFVAALMILFAVMCGSGTVSVCGKFVELRGSLMRIFWHVASPPELPG